MSEPALPKQPRDRAIDALRGIAMLCMIADHTAFGSHILWLLHLPNYLQGSSGFVLMAGFALGMVSLRRAEKLGWSGAYAKILKRTLQIYLIHLFLALMMTDIGLYTRGIRSVPTDSITFPQLLGDILLLRWLPTYMDILPLYVIFLLLTPLALECFRRGLAWLVFAVSFCLYATLQFYPHIFDFGWMLPGMARGFHQWGWQLVFFVGLAAGFSRVDLTLKKSPRIHNAAFAISMIVVVASFLLARVQAGDFGVHHLLSTSMEESLTQKYVHAPLRTLSIVAGAIVFYVVITALNNRGRWRAALEFLEVCGRNSLFIFVGHFTFVALRFAIGAKHWPPLGQDLWFCFVAASLYAVARWHPALIARLQGAFAAPQPAAA